MNTQLRLDDYPTTPLYNIKAVVQATGISPSTLRAWERRYQMCRPQRSESGYRLYSERDIVVIRWLKAQVDAGMAISQAVSWYENIIEEAGDEGVILPTPMAGMGFAGMGPGYSMEQPTGSSRMDVFPSGKRTPPAGVPSQIREFTSLQTELLQTLIHFDEETAEAVISEAFALYSIEEVGENVFLPVLVEIGEQWHRREIGVTTEHFATNYLRHRLTTLLRALPSLNTGPLIWVGCAPGELHEAGPILLALYLKRAGYRVRYLGQDLPGEDLIEETRRHLPAMILLSAATTKTAQSLANLTARLANLSPTPLIGYGGRIFNIPHDFPVRITGVFMGTTAVEAVAKVQELLGESSVLANR